MQTKPSPPSPKVIARRVDRMIAALEARPELIARTAVVTKALTTLKRKSLNL